MSVPSLSGMAFQYDISAVEKMRIGDYELFEDQPATMTIEEVLTHPPAFSHESGQKSAGFKDSNFWQKFSVINRLNLSRDALIEFNYPNTDHIDLYLVSNGKIIDHKVGGDMLPFSTRPIPYRNTVFSIAVPPTTEFDVYIRYKTQGSYYFDVLLWDQAAFHAAQVNEYMVLAGVFGILFVMFWYNLLIFMSVKDWGYLLYCLYLFLVSIAEANLCGFLSQYIFPNSPLVSNLMVPFSMLTSTGSSVLFSIHFLRVRENPRLLRIFMGYIAINFLLVFAVPFVRYNLIIGLATLLFTPSGLMMVTLGIWKYLNSQKYARFYISGWGLLLAFSVTKGLANAGFIEASFWSVWGIFIGSITEAIMLSFALGDRISTIQREKEEAQALTLKLSEENRAKLEGLVELRTSELEQEREVRLREAQLAALSDLAAGVAHEVNNPLTVINFVAENLRERMTDTKDQRLHKFLEMAVKASYRVNSIIESLLVMSRQNAGREVVEMEQITGHASNLMQEKLNSKKIQFRINVETHTKIICHKAEIINLLVILLQNAEDALATSEEKWIQVKVTEKDKNINISVLDSGGGVSPVLREKIFNPFFTTKKLGQGMGLGLYTASNIAKKHGGTLILGPGKPTQFSVTLPLGTAS